MMKIRVFTFNDVAHCDWQAEPDKLPLMATPMSPRAGVYNDHELGRDWGECKEKLLFLENVETKVFPEPCIPLILNYCKWNVEHSISDVGFMDLSSTICFSGGYPMQPENSRAE